MCIYIYSLTHSRTACPGSQRRFGSAAPSAAAAPQARGSSDRQRQTETDG